MNRLNALLDYSIRAGHLFGIPIRLHISLLFFLIAVGHMPSGWDFPHALEFEVLIVLSILAHELGHALTAKHYKLRGLSIMLHGFGGFATSSGYRSATQSLIITLAGPAVTFMIAALGLLIGKYAYNPLDPLSEPQLQIFILQEIGRISLLLGFANLLPMLPFDGGNALAAILQFKIPEFKARRLAAHIGLIIAPITLVCGVIYDKQLFIIFALMGVFSCYTHLANTGGVRFGEFLRDLKHSRELRAVKLREEERSVIYLEDVKARMKEREEKERLKKLLGVSSDDE